MTIYTFNNKITAVNRRLRLAATGLLLTATKTVGNSNKTIGNSIFAITEASIAKSGKNVNGTRGVKSFAVNSN